MEEVGNGLRVTDDEIIIEDPELISRTEDLARRWQCDHVAVLRRCLEDLRADEQGKKVVP